jgi:hypothetical protein
MNAARRILAYKCIHPHDQFVEGMNLLSFARVRASNAFADSTEADQLTFIQQRLLDDSIAASMTRWI